MSQPNFPSEFHRVMYMRAYEGTVVEFRELLQKYGHDNDLLDWMQKAITQRLTRESPGDYGDRATSGWQPTRDKQKILDQHYLDRGPQGAFNTNAKPQPSPDPHFELYEEASRAQAARFKHLLDQHGTDPAKLAILEKAMKAHVSREEPGGWGERQSPGWPEAAKKKQHFDAYKETATAVAAALATTSATTPTPARMASTPPAENQSASSELEALKTEVATLRRRVAQLENTQKNKLKL